MKDERFKQLEAYLKDPRLFRTTTLLKPEKIAHFKETVSDLNKIVILIKFNEDILPKIGSYDEFYGKIDQINTNLKDIIDSRLTQYDNTLDSRMGQIKTKVSEILVSSQRFISALLIYGEYFKPISGRHKLDEKLEFVNSQFNSISKRIDGVVEEEIKKQRKAIQAAQDLLLKRTEEKANEIMEKARLTAQGTALVDVQKQFSDLNTKYSNNIYLWGGVLTVTIILIVLYIYHGFNPPVENDINKLSDKVLNSFLISTYIKRVFIALSLGTILAFSLKMLRSYLHLKVVTNHKQALTNSISALVAAGSPGVQQDRILQTLVDQIVKQEETGLVKGLPEHDTNISMDSGLANALREITKNTQS